jgi:hypothetical protein
MAWQEPKTDWDPSDALTSADMNRMEENTKELKNALDGIGLQEGLIEVEHTDIQAKTTIKKDGHKIYDTSGSNSVQIGGTMVIAGETCAVSTALIDRGDENHYAVVGEVDEGRYAHRYHTPEGQVDLTITHYDEWQGSTKVDSYYRPELLFEGADYTDYGWGATYTADMVIDPKYGDIIVNNNTFWHSNNIKVLTGISAGSGTMAFAYPAGFNQSNTIVLAVKVNNQTIIPSYVENDTSDFYFSSSYIVPNATVSVVVLRAQ